MHAIDPTLFLFPVLWLLIMHQSYLSDISSVFVGLKHEL